MADFADLLLKIANNARLTPGELAELGRFGRETQSRNNFTAGVTNAAGGLNVPTPFFPIYSEVLQTTTASITIPVPTGFKHLLIVGNGRTTHTGNPAENILMRLNGDTGANYDHETMYRLNNSAGGTQDLSATATAIGTFATADADAGASGNCIAFVPNYISSFFKGVTGIGGGYFTGTAGAIVFADFGQRENVETIQSATIFPQLGSFAAGTAISMYGLF